MRRLSEALKLIAISYGLGIMHTVAILISIGTPLSLAAYVALKYPCNHGGGPWSWLWLVVVSALMILIDRTVNKTRMLTGLVLALSSVLMIVACDRFNILVQYDVWLCRGMPDFGQRHECVQSDDGECPSDDMFDRLIWKTERQAYSDLELVGFMQAADDLRKARDMETIDEACVRVREEFDRLRKTEGRVLPGKVITNLFGQSVSIENTTLMYLFHPLAVAQGILLEFPLDKDGNVIGCAIRSSAE